MTTAHKNITVTIAIMKVYVINVAVENHELLLHAGSRQTETDVSQAQAKAPIKHLFSIV